MLSQDSGSNREGPELVDIATRLNQSRSGCHRTLVELVSYGYVRQTQRGEYRLTTKLPAMGVGWFSKPGITDIANPGLQRLAAVSGELVRLAIVDGDRLTLVAKAQGANSGLLYDPDIGIDLKLSCSAAGHALLMTLSDDLAAEAVSRQGLGSPRDFGPMLPLPFRSCLPSARICGDPGCLCARHEAPWQHQCSGAEMPQPPLSLPDHRCASPKTRRPPVGAR